MYFLGTFYEKQFIQNTGLNGVAALHCVSSAYFKYFYEKLIIHDTGLVVI